MILRRCHALALTACLLSTASQAATSQATPATRPLFAPAPAALPQGSVEYVAVGGQSLLDADTAITKVALSDPALADVKLTSDHQVRVVGMKAGKTDLTLWSKTNPDGQTFHLVIGTDVAGLKRELADVPALRTVTAISDPVTIRLTGQVASLDAQQHAVALAKGSGEHVDNEVAVADKRMVAVEVRFAAVSTSTLKALGLNFQKLGSGFQFASAVPNSATNVQFSQPGGLDFTSSLPLSQAFNLLLASPGSNFMSAISALNSVNLAQILAEPTLTVRSGEDANFLAGGEIPIPVPQAGATAGSITIQYRKYGVQLHVHATVLSGDRIVMQVNPEVSELDYQNALTLQGFNIPAITARSTDTTIELGDGQSFVLAGLMYSTSSTAEEKVPGIGSLPIIGDFFKRSQKSGEQQELIIIATPHLISPMAPGAAPKLPGEDIAYSPTLAQSLLNTKQLDNFVVQYGLAKP
jgi:pilus assembly protein CpaC